jgi:hypothetical protein
MEKGNVFAGEPDPKGSTAARPLQLSTLSTLQLDTGRLLTYGRAEKTVGNPPIPALPKGFPIGR